MDKEKVIVLHGDRGGYGIDQIIDQTCTIGELIEKLSQFDENTKIVIGNDWQSSGHYYTFGIVDLIYKVECDEEGNFEEREEVW